MDRRLLVLAVGMFAIGTDSFVIAGILPEVTQSLGVSIALAGQMVTVYALSFAVLSPVIAAAAAHWPRKRLLLAGLAVFVIGNLVTAIAPTIEWVLASRFVAGLGAAMFSPTATATAASLVPAEKRARALAIVVAGLSGATALGSPLGTFIGGLGDWRATMWFVTVVGAVATIGVYVLLPAVPPLAGSIVARAPWSTQRHSRGAHPFDHTSGVFRILCGLHVSRSGLRSRDRWKARGLGRTSAPLGYRSHRWQPGGRILYRSVRQSDDCQRLACDRRGELRIDAMEQCAPLEFCPGSGCLGHLRLGLVGSPTAPVDQFVARIGVPLAGSEFGCPLCRRIGCRSHWGGWHHGA